MARIIEVEKAKALMSEAIEWSVMKWLTEKKRVRKTADKANEVLNSVERDIRQRWSAVFKAAYEKSGAASPETARLVRRIHEEHDAANRLRMQAEETFDGAEKRLSAAMAREGCRQAIEGWEHHLEAIRLAESAITSR
jgi:ADP-ribose pyrophosphatase YjhB (NUDIX family)